MTWGSYLAERRQYMASQAPAATTFVHRKNSDGTVDSICLFCYLTIGNEKSEGALISHEREHACSPLRGDRLTASANDGRARITWR
jgi:hypothetical protein